MHSEKTMYFRYLKRISIASVAIMYGLQPLIAQSANSVVNADETRARDLWRGAMSQNPPSTEGCFNAAYPSPVWERVECTLSVPRSHPTPRILQGGSANVVGNGRDWAAGATGLIVAAHGEFLNVTNVTSEESVAVRGGGGILGANEYSLQLNSNSNATTSVCAGHPRCTVWQQFIYSTDLVRNGQAGVFIQYWLINWGRAACPRGFRDSGNSCFKNSAIVAVPDMNITDLGKLQLQGTAVPGGNDMVFFSNETHVYSLKAKDSVLDLGMVWTQAEFNVVGNAGGSQADFNKGASVDVAVLIEDGSAAAPHCLRNQGTTGETNNLKLGPCISAAGSGTATPGIGFSEVN